jgi:hypothetical protein
MHYATMQFWPISVDVMTCTHFSSNQYATYFGHDLFFMLQLCNTTKIDFQVNQQRLKVIETKEECVGHQQVANEAKAQAEEAQAMVEELTKRLAEAGLHSDRPAGIVSGKIGRSQHKPKSGVASPQSPAANSEVGVPCICANLLEIITME